MDLGIAGRRALVCGASAGLGLACAKTLAAEGADVILVSRSGERLRQAAYQVSACATGDVRWHVADLSSAADRRALVAAVPQVDILVTNAGGPPALPVSDLDRAPDIEVIQLATSTATVALAAEALAVAPGQIAKTLSMRLPDEVVLLVTRGDARHDNRKYKERFCAKARMLEAAEVEAQTSHPIGGICPFGLRNPLRVYCDASLGAFDEVLPAGGTPNSAVRITPERMAQLTGAEWVDVTVDFASASRGIAA